MVTPFPPYISFSPGMPKSLGAAPVAIITDLDSNFLFPEKTNINLKIGVGKRNANLQTDSQFFGNFTIKHNFYLNNKNRTKAAKEKVY